MSTNAAFVTLTAYAAEAGPGLTNGVTLPLDFDDLVTIVDALVLMTRLTIDDDERDRAEDLADDLTIAALTLKGNQ